MASNVSFSQLAVAAGAIVVLAAGGARAQGQAPCEFPPTPFPGGSPAQASADIAAPGGGCGAGGGSPFFFSPPFGAEVPRNVEIRIGGDISTLGMDPPTFVLEVEDATTGERFAFSRDAGSVHTTAPLPGRAAAASVKPAAQKRGLHRWGSNLRRPGASGVARRP